MIKSYNEFVNEQLSKNDIYPFLLKGVLDVLNNHQDDVEYMTVEKDDKTAKIVISSASDKPMRELDNDITFFILPDNFKPNVGVGMETGSYKKNTEITKFDFSKDPKLVELAKVLYKDVVSMSGYGDVTSIYFVVKY